MEKFFSIDSLYDSQILKIEELLKNGWTVKMIAPVNCGKNEAMVGGAFIVLKFDED